MVFISKPIYDPTWSNRPNLMGRTVGLVFYTPKFWDCRKYNFYCNQFDEMRRGELSEKEMERRYQAKRAHRNCKRKHMSYPGYMYWVGPKRRYTFRYMGATHPRERWWKPFSVSKNGRYTRWFDNGPKSPENKITPEEMARHNEVMEPFNRRFRESLRKAEATMLEYERIRERR